MGAPKPFRFPLFAILALIPDFVEAVNSVGDVVRDAKAADSEGGTEITLDEGLLIEDTVHTALRGVSKKIALLAIKKVV